MDQASKMGRPRSEQARTAVLHAVDDLLVEVGYAAMTMKGIAERAGVGRQTVYRWWSTKAEILFEASVIDGQQELVVDASGDLAVDAAAFLDRLAKFLTTSPAGTAYRALLGEAQHDPAVATLLAGRDVVADSARHLLLADGLSANELDVAAASLAGPLVYWVLIGHNPVDWDIASFAGTFANQHA
jgi:AcrR family transcriptional regulator